MAELYHHIIMDHYRAPRRRGSLSHPTAVFQGVNPLCGDVLVIELVVDHRGVITDAAWRGEGCAISQAAASWWCESVIGKRLTTVTTTTPEAYLKKFAAPLSPSRIRCALLPLATMRGDEVYSS